MIDFVAGPDFWISPLKIIWINIVLSGDNAVVIAMEARSLRPEEQRRAIAWGSGFCRRVAGCADGGGGAIDGLAVFANLRRRVVDVDRRTVVEFRGRKR